MATNQTEKPAKLWRTGPNDATRATPDGRIWTPNTEVICTHESDRAGVTWRWGLVKDIRGEFNMTFVVDDLDPELTCGDRSKRYLLEVDYRRAFRRDEVQSMLNEAQDRLDDFMACHRGIGHALWDADRLRSIGREFTDILLTLRHVATAAAAWAARPVKSNEEEH